MIIDNAKYHHAILHALIERDERPYRAGLTELNEAQLPAGDVTVRVDFSTLNYKDALAITGKAPVVRHFPMVPGIDFAGSVQDSENSSYRVGDRVVLNGWGVGEQHWGGLAQLARVKGEWLIPLPVEFTARQSMAIGTAGYTAMLCVIALERHGIAPDSGEPTKPAAGIATMKMPTMRARCAAGNQ